MTSSIIDSLREWIKTELPNLQQPSEETLQALTQNSSSEELWQFVVTRLQTPEHAKLARAHLALSGESCAPPGEEYEKQLRNIRAETTTVESELKELRAQLEDDSGDPHDGTEAEAIREALSEVLTAREEHLSELTALLQNSVWRSNLDDEHDDEAAIYLAELLEQLTKECDISAWDESDSHEGALDESALRELEAAAAAVPHAQLADVLNKSLHKSKSRLKPSEMPLLRTDTSKAESIAVDAQLRAFADYERIREEHVLAKQRIDELVADLGGSDEERRMRMLAAQLAGERSLLAFAKQYDSETPHEVGRAKREVARKARSVRGLEEAAGNLCKGSLQLLEEAGGGWREGEKWGEELPRLVERAVEDAETLGTAIEKGMECELPRRKKGTIRRCRSVDSELRKRELEEWRNGCERVRERLQERADVVIEARESVMRRIEETLVPETEDGLKAASQCREIEAGRVRDEMRNWVTEPGKNAAPWLLQSP